MRLNRFAPALLLAALAATAACGARLDADPVADAHALTEGRFQLMVRTDSQAMDSLVYEAAYRQLGAVLPLAEEGAFTGTVEVTFSSDTSYAPVSVGAGGEDYDGGWYSGHGSSVGIGVSGGADITWQNAVMVVTVKGAEGARLWSARCRYRSGPGFGGGAAAGERTAESCLKALVQKFREQVPAAVRPGAISPSSGPPAGP